MSLANKIYIRIGCVLILFIGLLIGLMSNKTAPMIYTDNHAVHQMGDIVSIRGELQFLSVEVPEELRGGSIPGETQTGYFLVSDNPIQFVGRDLFSHEQIELKCSTFHLAGLLEGADKFLNQEVMITGRSFDRHTRYHRTPILIQVDKIEHVQ